MLTGDQFHKDYFLSNTTTPLFFKLLLMWSSVAGETPHLSSSITDSGFITINKAKIDIQQKAE